jgi:RND family efflux transporter MFP subunit
MPSQHPTNSFNRPPTGKPAPVLLISLFAVALIGLFLAGWIPKMQEAKELQKMHAETVGAVPVVHTVIAAPANTSETVSLPGNIDAILYTTIYARIDGYLKSRCVDIGDRVKTGELLAEIDTPTTDQKLDQGKADLDEADAGLLTAKANYKEAVAKLEAAKAEVQKAKSNVDYAAVTAERWQDLATRGAVSIQSKDEKVRMLNSTSSQLEADEANVNVAQAGVKAAQSQVEQAKAKVLAQKANVKRLEAELNFKRVVAPFDGVITARKVDPGALITQGSQTSTLELFQMAKIDKLRIYISVPQRISRYLKPGLIADILVQEYPDRTFKGKVTNVSGALDVNTRTRQTEVQIDNPDEALLPGMYATVRLTGVREAPWIRVPGTTIVIRPDGQYVVVVDNDKAHYQKVDIGRDFGSEVEIRTGLQGKEQVVISPSDDLREGDQVQAQLVKNVG